MESSHCIIGSGPAGSSSAYNLQHLLAKKKSTQESDHEEVTIFEEHPIPGTPIQCTGILSDSIADEINVPKDIIMNRINDVRIIAPSTEYIKLKLKLPNLVVHRGDLDRMLVDRAQDAGVNIRTNTRFLGLTSHNKQIKAVFRDNKTKKRSTISAASVIGANGPSSSIARFLNTSLRKNNISKLFPELAGPKNIPLATTQKSFVGIQATVKIDHDNFVDFYPHIGSFGWAVPETEDTMRIGIAATSDGMTAFKQLMKHYPGKITDRQGGLIPIYNPQWKSETMIHDTRILTVGDAASQVKATTGGGIIQSLKSGKDAAQAIVSNSSYESRWKKRIGLDLWIHLKMRNAFDKFSIDDWNSLVQAYNKGALKKILEERSRDYPSKFMLKMFLADPTLLKYGLKLFV